MTVPPVCVRFLDYVKQSGQEHPDDIDVRHSRHDSWQHSVPSPPPPPAPIPLRASLVWALISATWQLQEIALKLRWAAVCCRISVSCREETASVQEVCRTEHGV